MPVPFVKIPTDLCLYLCLYFPNDVEGEICL